MKKGRGDPCTLGVQFGPCSVRLLVLEHHRKGIRLLHCGEKLFSDDVHFKGVFDPHIKVACIRALQSLLADLRLKTAGATVGLDSRAVFLKRIPIDSWLEGDELEDQVLWEAEQFLIDPIDRYVIDFHVQDVSETAREVLLAVVRRTTLAEYAEVLEKSGLEPTCLDVDLFALNNAYEYITGGVESGLTALVDVEPGCVRYALLHERAFFSGTVSEMVCQPAHAFSLSGPISLQGQRPDGSLTFSKIVLSGSGALSEPVASDLRDGCDCPVEVARPFERLKIGRSLDFQTIHKQSPSYMIGLGLALRGILEA